jgi:hypothetical protein
LHEEPINAPQRVKPLGDAILGAALKRCSTLETPAPLLALTILESSASVRADVPAVWIPALLADAPWVASVDASDPQAWAEPPAAFGQIA